MVNESLAVVLVKIVEKFILKIVRPVFYVAREKLTKGKAFNIRIGPKWLLKLKRF